MKCGVRGEAPTLLLLELAAATTTSDAGGDSYCVVPFVCVCVLGGIAGCSCWRFFLRKLMVMLCVPAVAGVMHRATVVPVCGQVNPGRQQCIPVCLHVLSLRCNVTIGTKRCTETCKPASGSVIS